MIDSLFPPCVDPTPLPMSQSLWPITIIVALYLLFVLWLGRQFMANREPFQLRGVIKIYNIVQIIFNVALFIGGVRIVNVNSFYRLNCMLVVPMDHPYKSADRLLAYAYMVNKVLDLMDTVFMVLRKSYKQISLLHLIHHVYMAAAAFLIPRIYGYGGHIMVTGFLNVFIHAIMYSYYYLSAVNPQIKQSSWWKKYITIMQMMQFVIILAHNAWTYMQPDCAVPRSQIWMVFFMASLMVVMFTNFYIHTYILPKRQVKNKSKQN
ncbi:CG8534 [Drosophila busckii]|uniref:Elongation of very long chain fatty acids protein n=1 Tax=Drosophila busckii TaxID=30019 RepID=A0A0M4F5W3_DROBS|nr:elongation of very long chain fatty acids protein F [Drosophila busckii]ALC46970.1 CG8534 [Drosophila busckii]